MMTGLGGYSIILLIIYVSLNLHQLIIHTNLLTIGIVKDLDHIQKSLEDYLQTKRKAFPRFYFLSNDELLKILSNTRQPRLVNDYLSKCFDSIKNVNFISESSNEIIELCSQENEIIKLIEFDGIQHFISKENNPWMTSQHLFENQQRDIFKNNWCLENNIPLIRIPYTHLNNLCIEDLLLQSSKYLIRKE